MLARAKIKNTKISSKGQSFIQKFAPSKISRYTVCMTILRKMTGGKPVDIVVY